MSLDGCSIQGIAGSGKSTLIKLLCEEIKKNNLDVNILTPTNISAIIVDGQTLDKFNKKLRSIEIIKNSVKDFIIVDEVSMMKELFYKMLTVIKKIKPETKIIMVGHDLQFSPVKDRIGEHLDAKYYFNSDVFQELVCNNKLILTKCRRSDDRHFKNCSNINNVNISEYGHSLSNNNICYTNRKRIEINKMCMERQREKNKKIKWVELFLKKFEYSKLSQDVYLYKNTKLIAIKNNKDYGFVNGERFTVSNIDDKIIYIENEHKNKKIQIPINKFQRLFHVAYCITSHKSQGSTFNVPYTIHDWDQMSETCKYVSLSRASDFDYVNII
jgi:nucleoside-triphosphatase THEP1